LAEGVARPVTLNPPAARSVARVALDRVLDVRVDATPSRVTVPVALGRVIVLFAVGSVTVNVVLKASVVVPSKSIPPDAITAPDKIFAESVCESVVPTTFPVMP
jgi:hypothetical protein